jgi:hypothetical protein
MDASILIAPRWDPDFHVHTNASNLVVKVMLAQNPIGKCNQPIAYVSHLLNNMECNYTTIKHEALAMVYALYKFWHYLLGNKFVFYVDHMALLYLINELKVFRHIAWWLLLFLEHEFSMVYKPSKSHYVANVLLQLSNSIKNKGVFDQILYATLFTLQPTWLQDVHDYLSIKTLLVHLS